MVQLPCETNATLGQVNFLLDLLVSLNVPKSTRSEGPFYFPVIFSLLCVYEMLERPTLGLLSIENVLSYKHLYIVLQFIIFNKNAEKTLSKQAYFVRNLPS